MDDNIEAILVWSKVGKRRNQGMMTKVNPPPAGGLSSRAEVVEMAHFNLDEVSFFRSPHKLQLIPLPPLQEVRLFTSNADRERYDELATLYGIIVSLDYLEKAYVRDSIPQSQ